MFKHKTHHTKRVVSGGALVQQTHMQDKDHTWHVVRHHRAHIHGPKTWHSTHSHTKQAPQESKEDGRKALFAKFSNMSL
jgi:hypothetical protein